jgi:SAM-dependent methyltransferase
MLTPIAETGDYVRGGTQKDEYTADEVVEVACPLCGGSERQTLYTEHGAVGVVRCRGCSLIYTSPQIKSPEGIYHGDATVYLDEARLIFEGKAPHHRDPNYRQELHAIEKHRRPPGRFLDVGCNMGMLLRLAKGRGWEAVGVEPSPSLAPLAKRHGITVHNCFLHELPKSEHGTFDVVALSDVFEHITRPAELLAAAQLAMKPDGILYVKVPNALWSLFKQYALALFGRRPKRGLWDAYEHVVHYTDRTLRAMLEKNGLQVVEIATAPPVQTPNWHELVGHYYQYPTPPLVDFRRKLVRRGFYELGRVERLLRLGSLGYFVPNVVALCRKAAQAPPAESRKS